MSKYKVTFTKKDYVAGVFFNDSASEKEAIESAKLYNSNKYDHVRAELVDESDD